MAPKLIITRPDPAGRTFAKQVFRRLGQDVPVVHAPAFRIVPLDVEPPKADHLILTSAHAVAQALRLGLSPELPAWCVGDRTAQAARDAGFAARSADGDADALIGLIADSRPAGRLLHLAGRHTRGDLAGRLTRLGFDVKTCTAYDQVLNPPSRDLIAALGGNDPLVCPVFSPRSAAPLSGIENKAPLHGVAISPVVAEVLTDLHADTVTTARTPDARAMVETTCDVLERLLIGPS